MTQNKQLFTVRIEVEIVCLADDEKKATETARAAVRKELSPDDYEVAVAPFAQLPTGWDGEELPFLDAPIEEDDVTVQQWIARGAAPRYSEPPPADPVKP